MDKQEICQEGFEYNTHIHRNIFIYTIKYLKSLAHTHTRKTIIGERKNYKYPEKDDFNTCCCLNFFSKEKKCQSSWPYNNEKRY